MKEIGELLANFALFGKKKKLAFLKEDKHT